MAIASNCSPLGEQLPPFNGQRLQMG